MKVDLRFLLVSLLLHFGVYSLLSIILSAPLPTRDENIEVIFEDQKNPEVAQQYIPKLDHLNETDRNKKATILSEQEVNVKQESIAKNNGYANNQVPTKTTYTKKNVQNNERDLETSANKNFMPLEKNPMTQRTSSMHLDLPHIPEGSLTFLNTEFSTFASFFNRISPNIINFWGQNIREFAYFPQVRDRIILKDRWATQIEVVLDKKGYIKDVFVVHSAGMAEFDHAVIDAIKSSSPFLNPPSGLIEKDGYIHIHGQFTVLTRRPRIAN